RYASGWRSPRRRRYPAARGIRVRMFRGDLWDVQLPSPIGPRPCVLLTTNTLISRLNSVTVAEITSTQGPPSTHIELQTDSGLTGREYSYVNTTALHTVSKG